MSRMLSGMPNHVFTLGKFCEMFGAAKSTISEDIDILRETYRQFSLGDIETVVGAAGGVRFVMRMTPQATLEYIKGVCASLADPSRILPGGFFYMQNIMSMPEQVEKLGAMLAMPFAKNDPDFVMTVETKGITVAMMAARALGIPLVIARRDWKAFEGPVVTINYISGSNGRMQTMSLARRAVREGQKALIVDDFMKAGGTLRGMMDIMREFSVTVVGAAVLIATKAPERKRVDGVRSLMLLGDMIENTSVDITPSPWLEHVAAQSAQ